LFQKTEKNFKKIVPKVQLTFFTQQLFMTPPPQIFFKGEGGGYRIFLSSGRVVGYTCEAGFAWIRFEIKCWIRIRVETKMYFLFFMKTQNSCDNELIFAKFRFVKISVFAKISRKLSRKFGEGEMNICVVMLEFSWH
jgi:hypothetical protein